MGQLFRVYMKRPTYLRGKFEVKILILFSFYYFFNMKFIVKLVSIQHPVLIQTGPLLNTYHPLSPPSHPPIDLQIVLSF